jgi:NAD(P)-dependent dehydrogenase (short-subunit alcohol dehydrogenase family)
MERARRPGEAFYLRLDFTREVDLEPARQQTLTRIPIGRTGTVTDIAKGIVFLASDDTAFMTGAGLVVDGGITAQ